jgi:DNA-directed RNA polymerase subunit E'
MYQIVEGKDIIAVPPTKFSLDLNESIKESLAEKYEGKIMPDIGVVLSVTDVGEVGDGKILPGDPSAHYDVTFNILVWAPKMHEVVEGEIVDITEWGAFVRAGAIDGLVHISQVMDDYVSYDDKNAHLAGKESNKVLKVGDKVRARIISISLKEQNKIGLTMRQPFLGALSWNVPVEEVNEKKAEKPAGKKKK